MMYKAFLQPFVSRPGSINIAVFGIAFDRLVVFRTRNYFLRLYINAEDHF